MKVLYWLRIAVPIVLALTLIYVLSAIWGISKTYERIECLREAARKLSEHDAFPECPPPSALEKFVRSIHKW